MVDRRQLLLSGGALALAGAGAAYMGLRQMGSMADFSETVAATRAVLSARPEISDFLRYATLAPNGHNTQPWRFRVSESRIEILPDFSRRTPIVDPDDHHIFVSLGCAAENLAFAVGARGRPGALSFEPESDGASVLTFGGGPSVSLALFDAITTRQSTRADYDGKAVGAGDLQSLARAAEVPGVDLVLLTDRVLMDRVRDLVVAGNSVQIANPAFVQELKSWLRFNPREAARTGDGLFSATTGNPTLPTWLGPQLVDWVFKAGPENDKYARQIRSSSGIAVFIAQRNDREHWVLAGRACQRFALQATALGLKHAYINQPVEVAKLRPELASLVGMPGRRPNLVLRFGHGPSMPYSARRPVEAVLV
jgi:nitroreductase